VRPMRSLRRILIKGREMDEKDFGG
jgi:hypothetical protein